MALRMHANERDSLILDLLALKGFVSFKELEQKISGSPATIRRDLERLAIGNKLIRVRGGAKVFGGINPQLSENLHLAGVPFHVNVERNAREKEAIGRAAAQLCAAGEGIMIDGGSTTLQMCPHLAGLNLQVLTNSLHIVSALIGQGGTRLMVPSGAVFPEQNIILSVFGEDGMPNFHAPKLFMGAASIGPQGLLQADVVLVAAEKRLVERAEQIIVLADASKFVAPSGHVVCGLDVIDTIITDDRITDGAAQRIEAAGIELIVAGQATKCGPQSVSRQP
jgi:DeoR family transcriptional regulator, ulaG and ulaABCDEF operon transcriptional repressor